MFVAPFLSLFSGTKLLDMILIFFWQSTRTDEKS